MKPHIHVITLSVGDLDRALEVYRDVGLDSPDVVGAEFVGDDTTPAGAVVMFQLQGGLISRCIHVPSSPRMRTSRSRAEDGRVKHRPRRSHERGRGRPVSTGRSGRCAAHRAAP